MRHRKQSTTFGRSSAHRQALLGALVCALILEKRIKTTVPRARAASRLAERMVTLAKSGGLAQRRRALAVLRREDCVRELFSSIASQCGERQGGYTRMLKTTCQRNDGAPMAILEWVDIAAVSRKKKVTEKEQQTKA